MHGTGADKAGITMAATIKDIAKKTGLGPVSYTHLDVYKRQAQNTVKGVIILVVVILNVVTQRVMDKNNLKGREM